MTRRELIILLSGGVILHGPMARAQEPGRVYRLGVMVRGAREDAFFVGLLDGLRQSGFIEGQNISRSGALERHGLG